MQNVMSHKRCWGSKTQLGQKLGASPDSSDVWQTTTTHRMQHWELISPGWTYFCLSMPLAGFDGPGCCGCIDFPMLLNRSMNWHAIVHRRVCVKRKQLLSLWGSRSKKGIFLQCNLLNCEESFWLWQMGVELEISFRASCKSFFLQLPSSLLF